MKTLTAEQKNERLIKRNKLLDEEIKHLRQLINSSGRHITKLEAEILDINTNTMNAITNNNNRFNKN